MPSKLGGNRVCGHVLCLGYAMHLVQELNVGTVACAWGPNGLLMNEVNKQALLISINSNLPLQVFNQQNVIFECH